LALFCHKEFGGGAFLCNADTEPIIFKCRHLATDLIEIAKTCRPGEGIPDTGEKKNQEKNKNRKGTGGKKKKSKGDRRKGQGGKKKAKGKVNRGKKPVDDSDDDDNNDDQLEMHGSWVAGPGPMHRARFGQTRPSEKTRLILANPGNCYMRYTDDKVYGP